MTSPPRITLAIYDLDRTITSLPTWTPFLLFAARRLAPWRLTLIPLVAVAALCRAIGLIDRDRLKTVMHRCLLGPAVKPDRLDAIVQRFADRFVRDHIQPGAHRQIAADRADGRRIVIATAAHRFYAAAIADRLGIADLIATEAPRNAAGEILPGFDGANCYGAAKQRMIAQWLAERGIDRASAHIRFYSDHGSDAPTFAWGDEAVVINANVRLSALAQQEGWRSEDWRQRR